MEPMEALESAEHALRLAVREVLGPDWLDAPGAPAKTSLEGVRDAEARSRPGITVSGNLLDYTYVKPLLKLIRENRTQFEAVFPDFDTMDALFSYVANVRNTVAHARTLYAHERAMLEGISGEIRTALSNFRTRQSPVQRNYATLESVHDNFGNVGRGVFAGPGEHVGQVHRLVVGDTLTFECRAWDGRGRDIEWHVQFDHTYAGGYLKGHWRAVGRGTNVTIPVLVTDEMVGEYVNVGIYARNVGRFHLNGGQKGGGAAYDGAREFSYSVDPPFDDE